MAVVGCDCLPDWMDYRNNITLEENEEMEDFERGLKKIMEYYQLNRKEALETLLKAYNHYLCYEDLEKFVIPLKEMKLNKRYSK